VVVVNAERVRISGNNKMRQKLYRHHTQYPGGLKEISLEKMLARHPTRVIEHAVRGMLPHNRLGAKLRRHLHVYVGPEHPHYAQTGGTPPKPKEAPAKPAVEEAPVAEEPVEEAVESVAEETSEPVVEEAEGAAEAATEAAPEAEPEGGQATEEESTT
jgi:hypothetical protein